mmetsp:Transcript_49826/g.159246  ORF Transcript_49826/g.159246 Transcript_49826/m.159246 type:complete len:299 (+) Transcript_49826:132-1028(+)
MPCLAGAVRLHPGAVSSRRSCTLLSPGGQGGLLMGAPGGSARGSRRPRCERGSLRIVALRNIDWPEGLLLGCNGVLADTEPLMLASVNEALGAMGVGLQWSEGDYSTLLEVGGTRQRLWWYFSELEEGGEGPFAGLDANSSARDELVCAEASLANLPLLSPLRARTFGKGLNPLCRDAVSEEGMRRFLEAVGAGGLEARPGVEALVLDALDSGTRVAVCSASDPAVATAVLGAALPALVWVEWPSPALTLPCLPSTTTCLGTRFRRSECRPAPVGRWRCSPGTNRSVPSQRPTCTPVL